METLVLDLAYQPVARVSWQRAVTLLFAGKVEVVDSYEDRTVRSVTFEVQVPSVVRFLRRLVRRRPVVRFSRDNVYLRDDGRCQYCVQRVTRAEATFDHVVPRAHGGHTGWDNIVIACVPCNQRKGGRTPEQAGMRLRHQPFRPQKLKDTMRFTFTWQTGQPLSWKTWLRDATYWHGELEQD